MLAMVASYGALILLTLLFVAPLVWMISTAFKTNAEATRIVPTWIPEDPSLAGFDAIVQTTEQTPVFRWVMNSIIAHLGQASVVVATSAMAGYPLVRLEFRGKKLPTARSSAGL